MAAKPADSATGAAAVAAVDWKIQMSLFLIPVVIYGVMLLGQKFPRSEAASAGVTLGEGLFIRERGCVREGGCSGGGCCCHGVE